MEYKVRKVGRVWVAWDPYWRPITGLEWTGTSWHLNDGEYCIDLTDPEYAFGSAAMKTMCEQLSEPTDEDICKDWIGTPEWFFDRPVVLNPCAPRTLDSWRRLGVRRRTFKVRLNRKTFTKRTWKY
jgi:hypothetical protein